MIALGLTLWLVITGFPPVVLLWWLLSQHEQRHPAPKHRTTRF